MLLGYMSLLQQYLVIITIRQTHSIARTLCTVTDLFLLQQRQGVGQQGHPEAAGGDLGRHEGEEQLGRLAEALLSVQLVELAVLP